MLAVSDTGTGIPQDQINRVFEPFDTSKPTGQGSGLGLSMVHGFMKQSGGTVRVCSELGVGTSIKLFFPAMADKVLSETVAQDIEKQIDAPTARILIAEDQPEVMNIISRILRNAGHSVVEASSGDLALELFQIEGAFDLLLTDIVMPGKLQGPTLAHELRAAQPTLPVVFMTGYAHEAAMHGDDLLRKEDIRLMKPVSRTQLLEAVRLAAEG